MRPPIKELVLHLQTHGQYHPLFESYYLDITRSFYVAESNEQSEAFKNEAYKFIHHICTRVDEELQRSQAVLPDSSRILVQQTTEIALMESRLDWLAFDGQLYHPSVMMTCSWKTNHQH
jgi:cullin-4